MKTKHRFSGLAVAFGVLLPVVSLWASDSIVTPATAGHWEGNARIIVTWCHQTNLPVQLDIGADGSVVGTVGDARLEAGRFQQNRGWVGRKLNLATDYIITGNLSGAIVAAEGIDRSGVMIPLNLSGGNLKGGVNTTGWKFGGKKKMCLAAASLRMVRSR